MVDRGELWAIMRDGNVVLSVVCSLGTDGKLWARTSKGRRGILDGALVDREAADPATVKADYIAGRSVDPKYLVGPGTSPSGLVAIRDSERREAEWAAEISPPYARLSREGRLVIEHDTRDPQVRSAQIEVLGFRWSATWGSEFQRGGKTCVYAYVSNPDLLPAGDAVMLHDYDKLLSLQRDEENRGRREFEAMMCDGDNDGANPPRPTSTVFRDLAASLAAARPRVALGYRCDRQAKSQRMGIGWHLKQAAGEEAMRLWEQGAPEAEVEAALVSYESDPEYRKAAEEAAWR